MLNKTTYRPNAVVVVTDGQGQVLLCERELMDGRLIIQTVQGGIDDGELAEEAAFREMAEEIGVTREEVSSMRSASHTWRYDFLPADLARFPFSRHIGQEQQFFLATVSPNTTFSLDHHHPEFVRVFWGTTADLVAQSWEAKREGLAMALREWGLLQ
jgi:putative (di)nucleoside polyphosphate hydrolase